MTRELTKGDKVLWKGFVWVVLATNNFAGYYELATDYINEEGQERSDIQFVRKDAPDLSKASPETPLGKVEEE